MTQLSSIVGDESRLAVLGALASPRYVEGLTSTELADACGLRRTDVLEAIGHLRSVGVVRTDGERYRFDASSWRAVLAATAEVEIPMDPIIGFGMSDEERVVLDRYFSGRVLVEIPNQRAKRLVVLQRLALEFDPGVRLREHDVNALLRAFHPDVSMLRRLLIDEGFLDREPADGTVLYWRSGGRVTPLPSGS